MTFFDLPHSICASSWLTEDVKVVLEDNIAGDDISKTDHSQKSVFYHPKVWLLAAIYFYSMTGLSGIGFYLPTLLKVNGVKDALDVVLLLMVRYRFATGAMLLAARSADRHSVSVAGILQQPAH